MAHTVAPSSNNRLIERFSLVGRECGAAGQSTSSSVGSEIRALVASNSDRQVAATRDRIQTQVSQPRLVASLYPIASRHSITAARFLRAE